MMSGITIEIIQKRVSLPPKMMLSTTRHTHGRKLNYGYGEDIRVSNAYYLRVMTPSQKCARRVSQVFTSKSKASHATIRSSSRRASYMGSLPKHLELLSPTSPSTFSTQKGESDQVGNTFDEDQDEESEQTENTASEQTENTAASSPSREPVEKHVLKQSLQRLHSLGIYVKVSMTSPSTAHASLQLQAAKEGKLEFEPVGRTEEILGTENPSFSVQLVVDIPLDHSVTEKCIKPIEMAKKLGKFTEDDVPELLMVGPVDRVVCFQIKVRPLQNNSSTEEYGCCYVMISQLVTAASNAAGIAKCIKQSDGVQVELPVVSSSQSSAYMMEKRVRTLSTRHEEDVDEDIEDTMVTIKRPFQVKIGHRRVYGRNCSRKQNLC